MSIELAMLVSALQKSGDTQPSRYNLLSPISDCTFCKYDCWVLFSSMEHKVHVLLAFYETIANGFVAVSVVSVSKEDVVVV